MNSGFLILDKMCAPGKITVLAVMGNIVKSKQKQCSALALSSFRMNED